MTTHLSNAGTGPENEPLTAGEGAGGRRVVPSVLAVGQQPSRLQRRGRYVPDSMRHPAKMLPALAAMVIEAFTGPGELVVDPMCGIGTTLVEAINLGRHAAGMEYEPGFVELAAANVLRARHQGATGTARIVLGDARNIATAHASHKGEAALVLTSPPYGSYTHGQVRAGHSSHGGKVTKTNTSYTTHPRHPRTRGNLAYQRLPQLLDGFGDILAGTAELLQPDGVVAVTVRPIRIQGELVDLPGLVTDTAQQAGLVLTDRLAALLAGLRDGGLVNRASFFQMLETRRARARGIPACATVHEDLLVFMRAADLPEGRP